MLHSGVTSLGYKCSTGKCSVLALFILTVALTYDPIEF